MKSIIVKYNYYLLAVVQLCLCCLSFPIFFNNGFDASFYYYGDGMKNDGALVPYINEPIGEKRLHFDANDNIITSRQIPIRINNIFQFICKIPIRVNDIIVLTPIALY